MLDRQKRQESKPDEGPTIFHGRPNRTNLSQTSDRRISTRNGLKRSVRQMKRDDDLEEDIKDEESMLADAEVDLDEAQKQLESSHELDTRFHEPTEDVEDGAAEEPNWEECNREHVGH